MELLEYRTAWPDLCCGEGKTSSCPTCYDVPLAYSVYPNLMPTPHQISTLCLVTIWSNLHSGGVCICRVEFTWRCLSQFECANLQCACPRMGPIWCRINVAYLSCVCRHPSIQGFCVCVNLCILSVKGKMVSSICSSCVYTRSVVPRKQQQKPLTRET